MMTRPSKRARLSAQSARCLPENCTQQEHIRMCVVMSPKRLLDLDARFTDTDTRFARSLAIAAVEQQWRMYSEIALRDPRLLCASVQPRGVLWAWDLAEVALQASCGSVIDSVPMSLFVPTAWPRGSKMWDCASTFLCHWASYMSPQYFAPIAKALYAADETLLIAMAVQESLALLMQVPQALREDVDFLWSCIALQPALYRTVPESIRAADLDAELAFRAVRDDVNMYPHVPLAVRRTTHQNGARMAVCATLCGMYAVIPECYRLDTRTAELLGDPELLELLDTPEDTDQPTTLARMFVEGDNTLGMALACHATREDPLNYRHVPLPIQRRLDELTAHQYSQCTIGLVPALLPLLDQGSPLWCKVDFCAEVAMRAPSVYTALPTELRGDARILGAIPYSSFKAGHLLDAVPDGALRNRPASGGVAVALRIAIAMQPDIARRLLARQPFTLRICCEGDFMRELTRLKWLVYRLRRVFGGDIMRKLLETAMPGLVLADVRAAERISTMELAESRLWMHPLPKVCRDKDGWLQLVNSVAHSPNSDGGSTGLTPPADWCCLSHHHLLDDLS